MSPTRPPQRSPLPTAAASAAAAPPRGAPAQSRSALRPAAPQRGPQTPPRVRGCRAWHRRSGGSSATRRAFRLRSGAHRAAPPPRAAPARRPPVPRSLISSPPLVLRPVQQGLEPFGDRLARPEYTRAHGADRAIHQLGDLLVAHAFELAQLDRAAQ